ncbi:hypothetical protein CcaverHIS002_0200390 [Cutaneotrichosporon cavernicola]|uniref:MFS general substrate transporter n=1 Tax=Cutaneotrichosporon cavernicola TaxID=279322 RepID=A0AA48ID11_9TREE|nr:uncharacterized protein CcaverHIS019_0200430 [Cutaneotrichosporon cavernicola]BEI80879.1 hypothetical protein CcaverHIS002_0200390 [Cutaneotrichosporon cavernicola]BEI88681.1 hypothetical protein CcaverHIS019_0200430 [Cutaneotrichosporon cavernicola]BEI96454.1 hypothetical protein CcaverHIS631_0200430 [Cutaneotrichosporon cavernicola]BEJ04227.1 hypothetical protein CcaverHIS641_0200440 [Cutaneotrichosporon cavernicola]
MLEDEKKASDMGHVEVHQVLRKDSIHVAGEGDKELLREDEFTDKEYHRLRWKVDLIIMPLLMILYGLQYADKTSLSRGVIFGLKEDTGLGDAEYPNLTTFFYMSYAVAQYPMAWVLQRFPIGRALGTCVIIWGGLVIALAGCNNYASLAVVRVLLGWFESVVTPGFAIFTASWYLRREQTLRQSMYYAMNSCFAMIFGVGIYYLALNAQRNGGLAAWRVINVFLGGLTIGMGIIFVIMGGGPDEVWWLSKREKRMAKARIVSNATGGGEQHPWRWEQVRECFRDPQWWFSVGFNLLGCVYNGALTTFDSLIYESFGFTNLEVILFSMPTYGLTFVMIITMGFLVYKWPRLRFPIALVSQTIVAFVLLFVGLANVGKWAKWAVFMWSLMDTIASFVMAWPIISVNVAGRTKKSFFGASSLVSYCIGNLVGAQIMRPNDAPRYTKGLTAAAVILIGNIVLTANWWWYYVRENRKRRAENEGMSDEEITKQSEINGLMDLTDRQNRQFLYLC